MGHEHQAGRGLVSHVGDEVAPLRCRFQGQVGNPFGVEALLQQPANFGFIPAVRCAGINGLNAHEFLLQAHQFIGGFVHHVKQLL